MLTGSNKFVTCLVLRGDKPRDLFREFMRGVRALARSLVLLLAAERLCLSLSPARNSRKQFTS